MTDSSQLVAGSTDEQAKGSHTLDLVEALRIMVKHFRPFCESRGDDEVINQALAAIAKAGQEWSKLRMENQALRNLANNLRPGPISEAFGGIEHEKPYRDAVEETCPSCGKEHNRQCDDGWHI